MRSAPSLASQVVDDAGRELPDDVEEPLLGQVAGSPASTWTTRKPGSTDHLVGQVGIPAPDVRRGVDAGLGQRRRRARARRRSCRRCRPHPAGSAATCAWRAWPAAARSGQRLPATRNSKRLHAPGDGSRRPSQLAARLGAEALVHPQQRLLLLGRRGTGRGGRRRRRSRRRPGPDRGCRPARRATRPRSGAPWRSAGGCRPRACAGPARSGSGRGSRRPPARPGGARRSGRPRAGCG